MGDITLSGYKAAATAIAWTSGQSLDSLADNEWTDLSDEIDNSSDKYMLVDLELYLPSVAFSGTDSAIEVYLVPSVDGTNYPNWTGNVTTNEQENRKHFVDSIPTSGATEAQRLVARNIVLPNGKYKWGFRSRANVSLTTSNVAKWRPHQVTAA